MTELMVFHHAQGCTPGIHAFAEVLRRAGHVVHVPDLYDAQTFDDLDDGLAYAAEVGFATLVERGVRAADGLRSDVVYAGFSLGALPAQRLAQTRSGALGALLFSACVPVREFSATWPAGVALQVHGKEDDPWFADSGDLDSAADLVERVEGAALYLYPGDQHLFADSSLPAYDAHATSMLIERVLSFLSSVG